MSFPEKETEPNNQVVSYLKHPESKRSNFEYSMQAAGGGVMLLEFKWK